jgi:hypothetical protein
MILSKTVFIKKPTGKYFKYYLDLGYNLSNSLIEVKIEHLSKGSKSEIEVCCDYCGINKKISYTSYNKSTKNDEIKYACSKCGSIKQKELCIEKYGVDNTFKLDSVKEKINATILKKYGVESYTQTDEYKEKSKKTSLDKWGVEHYSKTDECKKRVKNTSLDRWGVESYTQTDEYKEKSKKTSLDKWGVEHYSKTEEYKEKSKKTSLDKWGVEHYSKTEEYKEKIKETSLDKWGVDNYSKTSECRLKVRETNLINFGVDNPMKSDDIKNKVISTNLDKWGFKSYTQTNEYREKSKKTNLEKWSSNNYKSSEYDKIGTLIKDDLNYIKYIDKSKYLLKCKNNHEYEIYYDNYYHRLKSKLPLCTICNPIGELNSIKEGELIKYIEKVYCGEIIKNYRDGLEIDVYLPDLKLGFEFNGLYWHSNKFKDNNYHLDKLKHFKSKNIRVINIWEDDWDLKTDIVKSQINNYFKLSTKIWARKCKVMEIDNKISRDFLDKNHIQGSYKQIIKSIGIYHNNELVSVMAFDHFEGRKRMEDNEWNLSRFCNKIGYTVVGGASKLLKFFFDNFNAKRVISYADRDWSDGNLYDKIGFQKIRETKSDYKYIINNIRTHKSNFKKNESELKNFLLRVYDCGKIKYEIINE